MILTLLFSSIRARLAGLQQDESGQTVVEYALIIVIVALAVLIASPTLASAVAEVFRETSSLLVKRSV